MNSAFTFQSTSTLRNSLLDLKESFFFPPMYRCFFLLLVLKADSFFFLPASSINSDEIRLAESELQTANWSLKGSSIFYLFFATFTTTFWRP